MPLGHLQDDDEQKVDTSPSPRIPETGYFKTSRPDGVITASGSEIRSNVSQPGGLPDFLLQVGKSHASPQLLSTTEQSGAESRNVELVKSREIVEDHIERLGRLAPWQHTPLQEVWSQCKTLLFSHAWKTVMGKHHSQGRLRCNEGQMRIFDTTLLRVLEEMSVNGDSRKIVPFPAKILKIFRQSGLLRPSLLTKILRMQMKQLYRRSMGIKATSPVSHESSISTTTILGDALDTWNEVLLAHHWVQNDTNASSVTDDPRNREGLQSKNTGEVLLGEDICVRILRLYPQTNKTSVIPLAVAAVLTQTALSIAPEQHHLENGSRSLAILRKLTKSGSLEERHFADILDDMQVTRYALATVRGLQTADKLDVIVKDTHCKAAADLLDEKSSSADPSPEPQDLDRLRPEIRSALRRADLGRLTMIWQRMRDQVEKERLQDDPSQAVLCQLTSAFFALQRSDLAVDIWSSIRKHGITPTPRYWQVMFMGCLDARDACSLAGFWSKMEECGVVPDVVMWTTRIQTLIIGGRWREGLVALEQLSEMWKEKSSSGKQISEVDKKDPNKTSLAPISPLSPLKAALTALRDLNRPDLASNLLTWAKAQSLPLDTHVFNILLRPQVRNATNIADVHSFLADMESHSCKPDSGTYTIILNGILSNPNSNFREKASDEQVAFLYGMFDHMEEHGIMPNEWTFSTILNGLLAPKASHNSTPDMTAVRAVLNRMNRASASQRIRPSPHFFTILMTHYLSLQSPDLPAAASLWKSISTSREAHACLDDIFYDRMIESYARIGDVEKMLYFLRRMSEERKTPGWMALLATLRLLVENQEWDAVADLVRDVEGGPGKGILRFAQRPKKGKYEFWALVDRCKVEGYVT